MCLLSILGALLTLASLPPLFPFIPSTFSHFLSYFCYFLSILSKLYILWYFFPRKLFYNWPYIADIFLGNFRHFLWTMLECSLLTVSHLSQGKEKRLRLWEVEEKYWQSFKLFIAQTVNKFRREKKNAVNKVNLNKINKKNFLQANEMKLIDPKTENKSLISTILFFISTTKAETSSK